MKKANFILLILLALTSCKYGSDDGVKKPYSKLIDYLKVKNEQSSTPSNLYRLDSAEKLKSKSKKIISNINKVDSFTRKYYAIESKENVTSRLKDMEVRVKQGIQICEEGSLELQEIIYGVGKQSYESSKLQTSISSIGNIVDSEILTLYSLQYIKRVYEACSGLAFHYMNEFSVEKYDDNPEALRIRKDLLSKFFGLTGMIKVISNDSKVVSDGLTDLYQSKKLTPKQFELIEELALSMKSATGKLQDFTDSVLEKGIPSELKDTYMETQAKSDALFAGKTLLFDPANPDHAVVDILVILSNLTWGSVQSTIGLGVILTHTVIITPSSWVLGGIFPQYFRPLRGPNIKVAKNGVQLYADVCGFPAVPGKISLGIWELDFCAGYSFASGHEGGHSRQSALLGPFYLPAAILSYALNMGHGGFIEHWADDWHVH